MKNYVLCQSEFLYYAVRNFPKNIKIDHFFTTKHGHDGVYSSLYIEQETFKKLSVCEEIIRTTSIPNVIIFLNNKEVLYDFTERKNVRYSKNDGVYQAFIKLYTLPQDQLETRINQYRLEQL